MKRSILFFIILNIVLTCSIGYSDFPTLREASQAYKNGQNNFCLDLLSQQEVRKRLVWNQDRRPLREDIAGATDIIYSAIEKKDSQMIGAVLNAAHWLAELKNIGYYYPYALQYAADMGNAEAVRLLYAHGAENIELEQDVRLRSSIQIMALHKDLTRFAREALKRHPEEALRVYQGRQLAIGETMLEVALENDNLDTALAVVQAAPEVILDRPEVFAAVKKYGEKAEAKDHPTYLTLLKTSALIVDLFSNPDKLTFENYDIWKDAKYDVETLYTATFAFNDRDLKEKILKQLSDKQRAAKTEGEANILGYLIWRLAPLHDMMAKRNKIMKQVIAERKHARETVRFVYH